MHLSIVIGLIDYVGNVIVLIVYRIELQCIGTKYNSAIRT